MPVSTRPESSYLLDNTEETRRLEQQDLIRAYSATEELELLAVPVDARVLDAGCGSGRVARIVARRYPDAQIDACDGSAALLASARELTPHGVRIRYFESQLESIRAIESSYDAVTCRYVFEHLREPSQVAREILRVLKPGGLAYIVDLDGLMFNLYPMSEKLRAYSDTLISRLPVDLYVGRKLPDILGKAGFKDVTWTILPGNIGPEDLELERENMVQRFDACATPIAAALGSERKGMEYRELYLKEMMRPNAVLFFNRFVVQARRA